MHIPEPQINPSTENIFLAGNDPLSMQGHHLENLGNENHRFLTPLKCFDINHPDNIMLLPSTAVGALLSGLAGHWGGHQGYNDLVVKQRLDNLHSTHGNAPEEQKLEELKKMQQDLRGQLDRLSGVCNQICLHSTDPNLRYMRERYGKPVSEMDQVQLDRIQQEMREQLNGMPPDEALDIGNQLRVKALGPKGACLLEPLYDRNAPAEQQIKNPLFIPAFRIDDNDDSNKGSGSGPGTPLVAANNNEAEKVAVAASVIFAATYALAKMTPQGRAATIAAAIVGYDTLNNTAEASNADVRIVTPQEAMPPIREMQGGDIMGPRQQIDHIVFKLTGYPPGHPDSTLSALKARDTDSAGKSPLMDSAAHMLIRADGQIEISDTHSRPLGSNPQIRAGDNAGAIGVYIESYNPATQQTLNQLRDTLEQRVREEGNAYPVSLVGAGTPEAMATAPAPQMGQAPVMPLQQSRPAMRAGSGF